MTTSTVLGVAAVALVALGAVFVYGAARRRDRTTAVGVLAQASGVRDRAGTVRRAGPGLHGAAEPSAVAVAVAVANRPQLAPSPPRHDSYGVTRREFFNRGALALVAVGLAGFGATSIAFVWPTLRGGFGSKIKAGRLDDILRTIHETGEPVYVPEGRFYLNPYPPDSLSNARASYAPGVLEGMEAGVVALYQKCVHLGCRVPWCKSSQWFECPCHLSKYNRVGEKKEGPAPRGLDRFATSVEGGVVVVDTGALSLGPPVGTDTTGQGLEGPHCA